MFILVRHAVAVSKRDWPYPDLERPLTPSGLQQSENLVAMLAKYSVSRLLSSPTARCRLTLDATAEQLRLPVENTDVLAPDAPVTDLLDLLEHLEFAGAPHAALCTHGESFAKLSRAWSNDWAGDCSAPTVADTPKGGCWVIENYNTTIATAVYLGQAVGKPIKPRLSRSLR